MLKKPTVSFFLLSMCYLLHYLLSFLSDLLLPLHIVLTGLQLLTMLDDYTLGVYYLLLANQNFVLMDILLLLICFVTSVHIRYIF